jgi:DNA polymerase-1
MEQRRFKVDVKKLYEFSSQLQSMMNEIQDKIFHLSGHPFNVNSPKQLGSVLFEEMGLPNPNKTKISTSADVLEKLRPINPIVGYVLQFREYSKFKSTYADALPLCADENGRVHTNFKQALTSTGRLSSTEPNLQNIPIRTELGRNFRKFFVSKNDDYVLIDADYSQIELRLLAAISGDENLTEVFNSGGDIHASTAMKLFGVEKDEVTIEQRKHAKAINFGIMYGMGSYSLSQDLQIPVYMADDYIKNYMRTYPKVADYFDKVISDARMNKYVTTMLGRRRYIPELSSPKKMEIAFGERVAKNSPIQGTAADIIKIAMVNVYEELKKSNIDAHLIMQVHDELIIESHKNCAEQAKKILKDCMENAVKLSVPLTTEIGSGQNWFEAH